MSGRSVAVTLNFGDLITSMVLITNPSRSEMVSANAIWDTGAGISVISKTIADKLHLTGDYSITIHGAFGASSGTLVGALASLTLGGCLLPLPCCIVDPDEIPGHGCELVLGLPFIRQGDFLITHHDGTSTAQFVYPPLIDLDVKDAAVNAGRKPAANPIPDF